MASAGATILKSPLPDYPPFLLGRMLEVTEGARNAIQTDLRSVVGEHTRFAHALGMADGANGRWHAMGIAGHRASSDLWLRHTCVHLPLVAAGGQRYLEKVSSREVRRYILCLREPRGIL
jgi:hypothetical protein